MGGGRNNQAGDNAGTTSDAGYATVGGGYNNTASNWYATVPGGYNNTASGWHATVPGGYMNTAQADYSFAAGHRARANNRSCFVWADASAWASVDCNDDHRWIARASGGVYFYTKWDLSTGVYVAAGGTSWNSISDQATKENFTPVDGLAILEKLATLPLQEYNLKSQDPSILHMGPVAQDFYAAFGYGESDRAINMEDADGVALVAIQGLYQMVQEKEAQIADLEGRVAALEAGGARPVEAGLLPGAGVLLAGLGLVWLARRGSALTLPKRGGP